MQTKNNGTPDNGLHRPCEQRTMPKVNKDVRGKSACFSTKPSHDTAPSCSVGSIVRYSLQTPPLATFKIVFIPQKHIFCLLRNASQSSSSPCPRGIGRIRAVERQKVTCHPVLIFLSEGERLLLRQLQHRILPYLRRLQNKHRQTLHLQVGVNLPHWQGLLMVVPVQI